MNDLERLLKELKELAAASQATLDSVDKMRTSRSWDYPPPNRITVLPSPESVLVKPEPIKTSPTPAPNPGNRKLMLN